MKPKLTYLHVKGCYNFIIATAKEKSNIIERIAASRKERHESTVEEMHQELSVINSVSYMYVFGFLGH
jgi:hypothetical protein